MLKQRKIPMRMCVGCREMKPKVELIRVVKPPEKEIDGEKVQLPCAIDRTGKAQGRGAYVCASVDCLKKAQKSKALERALEAKISDEVFESLASQMTQA